MFSIVLIYRKITVRLAHKNPKMHEQENHMNELGCYV